MDFSPMGRKKKRTLNDILQISGYHNNIPVISGLFYLINTHGIMLTDILIVLDKQNMVIDWFNLCDDAILLNFPINRLKAMIKESLQDTKYAQNYDRVYSTIEKYLEEKGTLNTDALDN